MEETMVRGDSAIIEFSIEEDITMDDIDTLILTARKYPDEDILFTKNKESFTLNDKICTVELLPENTQELTLDKIFLDIEITLIDGTRKTLLAIIKLKKDMTTHNSGGVENEN